jgi:predicted TIM-barrel fold metal-dependent hydrolase
MPTPSSPDGPAETRHGRLPIIDAHQHVGTAGEAGFSDEWARQDIAERQSRMQAMGLDRCVILPAPTAAGGFRNVDHAAVNDSLARYARLAPHLVEAAIATINLVEPQHACRELERSFESLGMPGVAFHHRYLGLHIDDPRMDVVLRVADEYQRTVFVHIISDSTFEAPWRLFALARRFPAVRFLALDGFSSANQSMMLRECAPDSPNVWFDTGAMTSVAHQLDAFIDRCGVDRLVLGTDLYSGRAYFRRAFPLVELQAMGLPAESLDTICNRNIRALLQPAASRDSTLHA